MTFIEKVNMAKDRIKEFILESLQKYDELPVISFSGGKDSCVLRHLVRSIPEGRKCKCVTSAELFHPQTFSFIQKTKIEGDVIFGFRKPFNKIISENGYPMISKMLAQKIWHVRNTNNPSTYVRAAFGLDGKTFGKIGHKYIHFLDKGFVRYEISHRCCDYIKGEVKHCKSPCFIGTTISESRLRKNSWIKNGCNFFNNEFQKAMSRPLSL
jgi:predicted phosphoadenosine phosphosulfate sulfurtransferase